MCGQTDGELSPMYVVKLHGGLVSSVCMSHVLFVQILWYAVSQNLCVWSDYMISCLISMCLVLL